MLSALSLSIPITCIKYLLLYYEIAIVLTFYGGSSDNWHKKFFHIYNNATVTLIMPSGLLFSIISCCEKLFLHKVVFLCDLNQEIKCLIMVKI